MVGSGSSGPGRLGWFMVRDEPGIGIGVVNSSVSISQCIEILFTPPIFAHPHLSAQTGCRIKLRICASCHVIRVQSHVTPKPLAHWLSTPCYVISWQSSFDARRKSTAVSRGGCEAVVRRLRIE